MGTLFPRIPQMIIRSIFALIVIWLLMPHEPDVGFGRPGFEEAVRQSMASTKLCALVATSNLCLSVSPVRDETQGRAQ